MDDAEPWRVWWLNRPAAYPYNTCFRPRNPGFLVFVPAGCSEAVVAPDIVEDVDPNEPVPPAVDPAAPFPNNRRGFPIFSDDSGYSRASGATSVSNVLSGSSIVATTAI